MSIVKHRGRIVLGILLLVIALGGCVPRGAMANPGWTVVTNADGVVYAVLATGQVVALEAERGGIQLWVYPSQQGGGGGIGCSIAKPAGSSGDSVLDAVYGLPVLTDDLLLVTSFDRHLYAFERASGAKLWQFPVADDAERLGSLVGGVNLVDGIAYFGSSDGSVYALDVATQELVWPQPFATGNRVWGTPAVDAERVYVGSLDHHLYAIDRQTGAEAWQLDLGGSIPGSVTLADGLLFAGAVDQRLHVVRAEDGSEVWQTPQLGAWVWGEALVHEGRVYFGTLGGQVYAYDARSGERIWGPVELNGAVRASPARFEDQLIFGTDTGAAYRVDIASGSVQEFPTLDGAVLSTPSVAGSDVYVATAAGKVYAFDVERGIALLWEYPPQKR
ncbi:MAG: PQQ-like beta-propeller repeat protein [Anaerolineae bacterium]|nr:PQQ-like beta-propeller repeat protein [Anaerolineae bacterium]